jgi:hypothetical protein
MGILQAADQKIIDLYDRFFGWVQEEHGWTLCALRFYSYGAILGAVVVDIGVNVLMGNFWMLLLIFLWIPTFVARGRDMKKAVQQNETYEDENTQRTLRSDALLSRDFIYVVRHAVLVTFPPLVIMIGAAHIALDDYVRFVTSIMMFTSMAHSFWIDTVFPRFPDRRVRQLRTAEAFNG